VTEAAPTAQSETGRLTRVVLKHARDAFRSANDIAREWQALNFTSAPDLDRAIAEYDAFAAILRDHGAQIEFLARSGDLSLDSIYVRDASVVCDRGVILGRMGKAARAGEPAASSHRGRSKVATSCGWQRARWPSAADTGRTTTGFGSCAHCSATASTR